MPAQLPGRQRGLIEFLRALARMRARPVYRLDAYERRVWLDEIPERRSCFSRHREPAAEDDPGIWISVTKEPEPNFPDPPEACEPWVGRINTNDDHTPPQLLPRIEVEVEGEVEDESEGDAGLERSSPLEVPDSGLEEDDDESEPVVTYEILHLTDHPQVEQAWSEWIRTSWEPWSKRHREWHSVHRIYTLLFQIYQDLQTKGDQLELVLGLGLLQWNPEAEPIRRHLITARAELTFDAPRGRFEVSSHPLDGDLTVELDMVPQGSLPYGLEQSARSGILAAHGDPWSREAIEPVLVSVANQLDQRGTFDDSESAPRHAGDWPLLSRSPALLLRKRSARSESKFLSDIAKQIEFDPTAAPAAWLDLAETHSSHQPDTSKSAANAISPSEMYFPLPTNDEQLRIIRTLESRSGATVQGPPGTGKSHTIANLICHLLASGKRVLISAQTARALAVLHAKLPESIQPLAVSMLGEGKGELEALESSVRGITDRHGTDAADEWNAKADQLSAERRTRCSEAARLGTKIRAVRERDTKHNRVGRFEGSAGSIAAELEANAADFAWFRDDVPWDSGLNLAPHRLRELAEEQRSLSESGHSGSVLRRPTEVAALPSPAEFEELVQMDRAASKLAGDTTPPAGLDEVNTARIAGAIEALREFQGALQAARRVRRPWAETALEECLQGEDHTWRTRAHETRRILDEVPDSPTDAQTASIVMRTEHPWSQVARDATVIHDYLVGGGSLGPVRRLFAPRTVKEARYLQREITIGSQPPKSARDFALLIEAASCEAAFHQLDQIWDGQEPSSSAAGPVRRSHFAQVLDAATAVIAAREAAAAVLVEIELIPTVDEPDWQDEGAVAQALARVETLRALKILDRCRRRVRQISAALRQHHDGAGVDRPRTEAMLEAVISGDAATYARIWKDSRRWEALDDRADVLRCELDTLAADFPHLAASIREGLDPETAAAWSDALAEAIDRSKAHNWIRFVLHESDLPTLCEELDRREKEIQSLTAEEAAARAWAQTFDRMTEGHKRSLIAWQQSMKRLGKGTGKYAEKHRLEARKHLSDCREAIPAWIMPLHRVFDTVDPQPGMFDVVIVDEASQCGLNALSLVYVGKKILVVGDDDQISPSAVGVDRSIVDQYVREYLNDLTLKSSFSAEASLFDHAVLRFGQRIALREHFRCMPEIIRFSNDLCYERRLMPMREFGADRLAPIAAVHVADGSKKGSSGRAINEPEADAVVSKIVECLEDPRYLRDDRPLSMGVISLTGDAQAQHIADQLVRTIGPEQMEERGLICGNAYDFQGDERDVVFLSMVASPGQNNPALTARQFKQRFNVAASRAKDQLWLFHSVMPGDLSPECIRRRLLEHFLDPSRTDRSIAGIELEDLQRQFERANRSVQRPPSPFDSWFEVDVALEILRRGYRVHSQFVHAGYRIDLLVEGSRARLAVECDGDHWHGPDRYEEDLHRQRQLERAGLRFERIRELAFYSDREAALEPLWTALQERGILPTGEYNEPRRDEPNNGAAATVATDPEPTEPASAGDGSGLFDGLQLPTPDETAQVEPTEATGHSPGASTLSSSPSQPLSPTADEDPPATPKPARPAEPVDTAPGTASAAEGESRPYQHWEAPADRLPDPTTAAIADVAAGLEAIIRIEGPVKATRAYRLYTKAAGLQRAGRAIQSTLNKAAARLERNRRIQCEVEDGSKPRLSAVLRIHGSPSVRPRTRGDRTFADIPHSELRWFMKRILRESPSLSTETLIRRVAAHYGLQRLRQPTREILEAAAEADTAQR